MRLGVSGQLLSGTHELSQIVDVLQSLDVDAIELKTLPLGLTMFQAQIPIKTPWQLVMAAATFSVLPVLIVFIVGQKYYVRGIATTGLKG